jgi:hypothetical protein
MSCSCSSTGGSVINHFDSDCGELPNLINLETDTSVKANIFDFHSYIVDGTVDRQRGAKHSFKTSENVWEEDWEEGEEKENALV